MKKMLTKFAENALAPEQMKSVKGGWEYSYSCQCGSVSYAGHGDLNSYREDAQYYCASGSPVRCEFT